jgi:hypothetical protein
MPPMATSGSQVNLSGSNWSDVAVLHDTGPNLTVGDSVLRMMLDGTQMQAHV